MRCAVDLSVLVVLLQGRDEGRGLPGYEDDGHEDDAHGRDLAQHRVRRDVSIPHSADGDDEEVERLVEGHDQPVGRRVLDEEHQPAAQDDDGEHGEDEVGDAAAELVVGPEGEAAQLGDAEELVHAQEAGEDQPLPHDSEGGDEGHEAAVDGGGGGYPVELVDGEDDGEDGADVDGGPAREEVEGAARGQADEEVGDVEEGEDELEEVDGAVGVVGRVGLHHPQQRR